MSSGEFRGASCAFAPKTAQAAASAQEKTHRAMSRKRRHAPGHGHATHDRGDAKHENFSFVGRQPAPDCLSIDVFDVSRLCLGSGFLKGRYGKS